MGGVTFKREWGALYQQIGCGPAGSEDAKVCAPTLSKAGHKADAVLAPNQKYRKQPHAQ